MVEIDVTCHLEAFRRFLVNSTCRSFIPESYLRDPEVFPEKESEPGSIYIEAADKVTLKRIRDITFVNANEVLGIIYKSKSGHSMLKWRHIEHEMGRVTGDASNNSLVNLSMAGVISPEYVEELASREREMDEEPHDTPPPPINAEPSADSTAAPARPPIAGEPGVPPDEEEEDFEAADADEDEQEDLEEQEREETA
ncbi:MAG TPA: hypothetical protein VND40_04165 [Nitrososphaerales archaeon]|nr:hypothetical protein [Nitrososphaerales archaeon]